LFFGIHPLRAESVAWVTERRDVLSGLFCSATVLAWLRSTDADADRRWYGISLGLFACALLSKATSLTLPAVLVLLNIYPLKRRDRRAYVELVPFFLLAAATAPLTLVALKPPDQLHTAGKIAVSAYSLAFYLWKTIAPSGLAPLYEMPRAVDPSALRYVVSYVVVAAVTALAWMGRRRLPAVVPGLAVFLAVMLPLLGVVQNGPQVAADRYTYHAAPALAVLIGAAVQGWQKPSRHVRLAMAGTLVAVLAALTWRQTEFWRDSDRLWARVLSIDSTSSIAHVAMGDLRIREGRLDDAEAHYRRGVALDPTFAAGFNNLGVVLARQGKLDEAVQRYREALALRPGYADAHNNWGIALSQQSDYAGAIAQFQQVIALDTANAAAEVNLGNAFVRQQRADSAVSHYARAAALRPGEADAYLNWGVALAQMGRMSDAVAQFQRALAIQPDNADARAYLERAERLRAAR